MCSVGVGRSHVVRDLNALADNPIPPACDSVFVGTIPGLEDMLGGGGQRDRFNARLRGDKDAVSQGLTYRMFDAQQVFPRYHVRFTLDQDVVADAEA